MSCPVVLYARTARRYGTTIGGHPHPRRRAADGHVHDEECIMQSTLQEDPATPTLLHSAAAVDAASSQPNTPTSSRLLLAWPDETFASTLSTISEESVMLDVRPDCSSFAFVNCPRAPLPAINPCPRAAVFVDRGPVYYLTLPLETTPVSL